jgi:hypothetical protein
MPATCGALLQEWDETGRVRGAMEGKIAQNRNTNQTLTYFGGLFPPLLLGTEGNAAEKQRLLDIQARRDELIRAGRQLGCPALR